MPALLVLAMTVAQMQGQRRVLVIAAPTADDPRLRAQRAALSAWGTGAADRDVSVVEVVGRVVSGAADEAAALRARYRLSPTGFTAVLVGKDGHVAYRSTEPVPTERLQGTIDAMPMRRAGQR